MSEKAIIIRDDKGKFKDVGDVLAIARAEGKKLFKTHENILVVRLFYDGELGWIAVIRQPGCSNTAGVSGGEKR